MPSNRDLLPDSSAVRTDGRVLARGGPGRGRDALQTLFDVGRVLASTLDFTALLQKTMTLSRDTIGSETASVMLADPKTGDLVLVCAEGLPEDARPGTRLSGAGGIAEWVFRRGEPVLLLGDPTDDERFRSTGTRDHIRSALSVPLVGKSGPVGVLSLNNSTQRNCFTRDDLDLLSAIGTQAGIAVENARLHQQVAETNRQLTATVDHLRNLTSSLISMTEPSLDTSLQTMLDAALEGTGARAGVLSVLDQGDSSYTIEAVGYDEGLLLSGDGNDWPAAAAAITADYDVLTGVSEPSSHTMVRVLSADRKPVGLLKILAHPDGEGFDAADCEFVDALVEHAAIVVHNSMLYQQAEAGRQALQAAYTELSDKQERLIHSEKLAAIGEMAAKVCHEINNPLTAISGCTQLMRRKLGTEASPPDHAEAYERYLATIATETARCSRITSELLQSTRRSTAAFHPFDLHDILNHSVAVLDYGEHSEQMVVADFDFDIPRLLGDAQQMTQVFLNLLTNAADAMPDGGRIHISTRLSGGHGAGGDTVQIRIRDEGPGIPEEDPLRLFDPFYTTKPGGTGLGLTICRGIVEKHKGILHLANAPEGGAEATILIPVDPTGEALPPASPVLEGFDYHSDLAEVLLETGAITLEELQGQERVG